MVAVVERGGFLWFYEIFFVDFVDFFAVSSFFGPGILIHGSHSHWLTGGGTSGILWVFFSVGSFYWPGILIHGGPSLDVACGLWPVAGGLWPVS